MNNNFDETTEKFIRPKIYKLLPLIDTRLGNIELDISMRPIIATTELLERGFIKYRIANDNSVSESDIKTKLFTFIHIIVNDWYVEKYENIHKGSPIIKSHIFINGISYELEIPLSISEYTGDNITAWMNIPCDVKSKEDLLSWIKNKPNFQNFSKNEIATIRGNIIENANSFRKMNSSYFSLGKLTKEQTSAYNNVVSSLMSVSETFINSSENKGHIMWNIHFATEECLKFALLRKGLSIPHTHNLKKLYKSLFHNENYPKFLIIYPSDAAKNERYFCERSMKELNLFYQESLKICAEIMNSLPKTFEIEKIALRVKYAFAL